MPNRTYISTAARPVRRALRRWRRRLDPKIVVLLYHRVADVPSDPWDLCVTPRHFDEHLSVLKQHVDVIPISEMQGALESGSFASRMAAITFDDGYADNLYAAQPILERHDLPATFFLTSGLLGSEHEFWWDELERILVQCACLPATLDLTLGAERRTWKLNGESEWNAAAGKWHREWRASNPPETPRQRLYLAVWKILHPLPPAERQAAMTSLADWAGLTRWPRASHRILNPDEAGVLASRRRVEIGAHSVHHAALSAQPLSAQSDEIRSSKSSIEAMLDRRVNYFAYPYGDFSGETTTLVREAGFSAAFSAREGTAGPRGSRWEWPRRKVCDWSGAEFSRKLSAMLEQD
ncbi:MAG: polysaccharide deacetylase family protein [Rhodothermales bacterium]